MTAATPRAFAAALRSARPGQRVMTPFLSADGIGVLPVELRRSGESPQYLLSDKPEYFRTGDGIAMQEEVKPGVVRLYLYHVPEPTGAKKVVASVIENLSNEPMRLEMLRRGAPAPSGDYHALAKQALADYWDESWVRPAPVVVPPRGRVLVDEALSSAVVTKDILVHGLYEFRVDRPARVTVFQKDPGAPIEVMDRLPKLPLVLPGFHPSGAGRGLFAGADVDGELAGGGVYDTARGVRQIVVADGVTDAWVTGRDSLTPGVPAVNKGNYGVMYRLKLRLKSTDGRRVALLIATDRSGRWCEAAGATVRVREGTGPARTLLLPSDTPRFQRMPEACVIGTLAPKPGEVIEVELTYSPPGASCLPTPILLVPFE